MSQSEMEMMGACEQCGSPLPARRKLKAYYSYACRGQHNALKAISGPSGLSGTKNTKHIKALRRLKRQSVRGFSFVRINSCARAGSAIIMAARPAANTIGKSPLKRSGFSFKIQKSCACGPCCDGRQRLVVELRVHECSVLSPVLHRAGAFSLSNAQAVL
jgi:hypothetical protein